jgi:flagellin
MPGLVINTNVPSLNAQRNMQKSSSALSKALERLSSGLRINRAGDDAAGLAISENLRSQVRGLNQAVRNAGDGISVVQTAEGAIGTYTDILQRVRELSIQAASDINSDDNRASIQLEITEQLEELQRIATTINFNGLMLLDGTFQNKFIQVGADYNQTLDISVGNLQTSSVGAVALTTSTNVNQTVLAAGDILINGYQIGGTSDDGVSTVAGSASAIAKANAINAAYSNTGVSATAQAAVVTGTADITVGTLDATDYITINGVQFGTASETIPVSANDADGALIRAINAHSNTTGVVATIAANRLILTSADGRNITYNQSTAAARTIIGLAGAAATTVTTGGTLRLQSDSAFIVADGAGDATTLIGFEGSQGIDFTTAINSIDVTTFVSAENSILLIDNALRQISDIRARLGALTNRLENTIANLMISAENLSASESRIRDADFAAETAALTRAQILQQTGVAVLAQANTTPQAALQLLQ